VYKGVPALRFDGAINSGLRVADSIEALVRERRLPTHAFSLEIQMTIADATAAGRHVRALAAAAQDTAGFVSDAAQAYSKVLYALTHAFVCFLSRVPYMCPDAYTRTHSHTRTHTHTHHTRPPPARARTHTLPLCASRSRSHSLSHTKGLGSAVRDQQRGRDSDHPLLSLTSSQQRRQQPRPHVICVTYPRRSACAGCMDASRRGLYIYIYIYILSRAHTHTHTSYRTSRLFYAC
jgi:hypothetical protein